MGVDHMIRARRLQQSDRLACNAEIGFTKFKAAHADAG